MKATLLSFFFCFFLIQNGSAQDFHKVLVKAFGSQDSAAYYFKMAKKKIKTPADEAEFYFCKNAKYTDYNLQDSAIFYGNIAIKKFRNLKDYNKLLYVFNNLGKTYLKQGKYEKAIGVYFEGLKIAEKEKNKLWTQYFPIAISNAYHDFEEYENGVTYGKIALGKAIKYDDKSNLNIASALNVIAINFDDWNKPDSALSYHFKVFKYIKGIDTLKIGSTYNNIGNTLLKQKKFKKAEKWIQRAVDIARANVNGVKDASYYYENATNFNNLATIAYQLQEYDKAEKLFDTAYFYAHKSESIEKLKDYYYQRYLFNKKRNNSAKALEFQEKYLVLRDSVFKKERAAIFAELETKYQTEKKEKLIQKSKTEIALKELEIKKGQTQLFILALSSFALIIIAFLIYRQQKLKNKQQEQEFELKSAIAKIENQNKLHEQRLSISRDLHDNIGSQLTFIISSVDNIKYAFEIQNTKLDNQLSRISDFAKATIIELRDTIWAMNNNEFTFEDLRSRIFNFIEKAKTAKENIDFKFNVDDTLKEVKFSSVVGINLYRTIQEAINNAIKYAEATEISVNVAHVSNIIQIEICDNGKGFDTKNTNFGNGISNMEKRIDEIGGEIDIASKIDIGTKINITIPQ